MRNVLGLIQIIAIPAVCGWLCHEILASQGNPEPIYPAALVLIMAYIITTAFALVMSCALDTLFVCCVRDKTEYKAVFMSEWLHKAFGFDKTDRKEKRAEKRAAKAAKGGE